MKRRDCILSFLRERLGFFLLLIGILAIFTAVLTLYDVPAGAIEYACVLSCTLAAVSAGIDWCCYSRRAKRRAELLCALPNVISLLPEPSSMLEEDYQQMLRELCRLQEERETGLARERQESLDYYTTWVH